MSLGDGGTYNSTQTSQLSDELASLVALDVMVISAAGNEYTTAGTPGISYPAVDPNSLCGGCGLGWRQWWTLELGRWYNR